MAAKVRLRELGILPADYDLDMRNANSNASKFMRELFGFEDYMTFGQASSRNPEIIRKLQLLAGPNAYAIYKAMKAKQDAS